MTYRGAGVVAALMLLAACAKTGENPQSQSPTVTTANPADVAFMQGMIGHHQQALVMTAMAPSHGAGSSLLFLAQKIDISQNDEIKLMQGWLRDRGAPLPDSTAHQHMLMPGMLTAAQLAQLDAARGVEFERLFLTFMIQHHTGALTMVDTLFAAPGAGQDSDIFRFATDVGTDQRDEIFAMEKMLSTLPRSTP